jgi:hypothetical protein
MMGAQEIAIMTVVAIWLGIIVILLILGFRFKAKNGLFLKERHAQEDDFAQHKDKFTLQPVDISYELPVGELGYFVGESTMFKKPLKQKQMRPSFWTVVAKKKAKPTAQQWMTMMMTMICVFYISLNLKNNTFPCDNLIWQNQSPLEHCTWRTFVF